jgi:hypothetical protein
MENYSGMKYLLIIVFLVAVLITAGCSGENQNPAVTSTQGTPLTTFSPLPTTNPPSTSAPLVQMTTQPARTPPSVQMTTQPARTPSSAQMTTHGLNIGDTAIIEYNGLKISVIVTGFSETSGLVYYNEKNIGDKVITLATPKWVVDQDGIRHDSPDPWLGGNFYPGESKTSELNLFSFQGMNRGGKAWNGRLTFYYGLGDQYASWIIKSYQ